MKKDYLAESSVWSLIYVVCTGQSSTMYIVYIDVRTFHLR